MKWVDMKVNKKLLPIKGHYLLFNAGTAPLVPYLSTYARQLGFSSATVGLIYTVLPICGLVAKPLFGVIADRFKIQKLLFILFEIVTIVSFLAIYLIPESNINISVQLDCGDGMTFLRSCYKNSESIDQCKLSSVGNTNSTASCNMNCDMSSPKMWETVCEHWHIPQFCYSDTNSITYQSIASNITMNDNCAYIRVENVTLEGHTYNPQCRIGDGYVDVNEPCRLKCGSANITELLSKEILNMTCLNNHLHYRTCPNETASWASMDSFDDVCEATCDLDVHSPWKLMEICEGWQADIAEVCNPKTHMGTDLPTNLSFVGSVKLSTTIQEHECVFMQMHEIVLADGSTHYPYCVTKAQYQTETNLFHSSCNISCDNAMANEIFHAATESRADNSHQFSRQFWLFFLCMIVSWIGQAVVVSIADALCFNLLGDKTSLYGKQRLWGSVGFGIFSLLTGTLIDLFSEGAVKNYTVAFVLMFVFMLGDVIVSFMIKTEPTRLSLNILKDVGTLFYSVHTVIFFLWTIVVGLCTALIWNFLFWHIEDVAGMSCNGSDYVKTLQGIVSAIQTFCGEIPFLFLSGYILKKLGHVNMMSLVLFAFGVRFILYSFLTNAWWVLPIELFQGLTFGMFYPTMASYANVVSPPGTETTVQGLVGAIFEGVGTSLGSFIGGRLFEAYGGWSTFRWFGIGSLVFCILHIIAQYLIKDRMPRGLPPDYATVTYELDDTIDIMENNDDFYFDSD